MIETEYERYTRLVNMIETVRDEDRPLTSWETRELSEMLVRYIPVYDYISDVRGFGTVWYGISEYYGNLTDLDIALEYITRGEYRDIDEEEYVNEHYRNILDTLPYYCEYNLSDDEVIYLFEMYVVEPEVEE
jgi:hypothetical protein